MTVSLADTLAEVEAVPPTGPVVIGPRRTDDYGIAIDWTGADLFNAVTLVLRFHPLTRKLAIERVEAGGKVNDRRRQPAPGKEGKSYANEARRSLASGRVILTAEGEALRQEVCERVLARKGLEKVANEYLGRVLQTVMQRSQTWQETSDRYRSARERQEDAGPMVEPSGHASDYAGNLAAAVAAGTLDVAPADVPDLARIVAARLVDSADVVTHRRLTARLVQAMALAADDDAALALADLAAGTGRTLNAVRIDATRGAEILTALDIPTGELLATVREAARASGLGKVARDDRPDLERALPGKGRLALAAAEAVRAVALTGGAWDDESIGTDRKMPAVRDRGPIVDAAPFPSLRRPDVAPPSSPVGRGPTVPEGAPTVRMTARQRQEDPASAAAREGRYVAVLDRIGKGADPAPRKRSTGKRPTVKLAPIVPVWALPYGDCGTAVVIHPTRGLIRR